MSGLVIQSNRGIIETDCLSGGIMQTEMSSFRSKNNTEGSKHTKKTLRICNACAKPFRGPI